MEINGNTCFYDSVIKTFRNDRHFSCNPLIGAFDFRSKSSTVAHKSQNLVIFFPKLYGVIPLKPCKPCNSNDPYFIRSSILVEKLIKKNQFKIFQDSTGFRMELLCNFIKYYIISRNDLCVNSFKDEI